MAKHRTRSKTPNPVVDPWTWARDYLTSPEFDSLTTAIKADPLISIRINQLKSKSAEAIEKLKNRYGWETTPVPFCESGYWIENSEFAPSKTIEHRMGYYYIQEAASMLPAELFDLGDIPHSLILDMAASPGGKTIHLVDRTKDMGLMIANDSSRSRITALRIVLQNWGAINQAVTNMPGEWFGSAYPETFDAVLLDAPCSMQGLRTSSSHSMRPITESEIQMLAERQLHLLESALRTVKIGGQVVYSTCTLSPLENEAVVSHILEKYGNSIEIENIQQLLPKPAPAIAQFGGLTFNKDITHTARLWPHVYGTAGFFSAKFRKSDSLPIKKEASMWRGKARINGSYLSDKESSALCERISNQYGIDLQEVLESMQLNLWEQNRSTYLVPGKISSQFAELPILSMGMLTGKAYPKGWQPSHEFVSRFGDLFSEGIYTLEDAYLKAWQRGEDIRGLGDTGKLSGKILAVRDADGRNFGRGKMLEKRLKNMLPTRLF